jgi:hypothetical protein
MNVNCVGVEFKEIKINTLKIHSKFKIRNSKLPRMGLDFDKGS